MTEFTTSAAPNPGSPEAAKRGCTCPRIDNGHGHGYLGQLGIFVMTGGCPLHWPDLGRARLDEEGR